MSDKREPSSRQDIELEAKAEYIQMLDKIQSDPYSDDAWKNAVDLAREEETFGGGTESYYTKIPLDELVMVGEKLRDAWIKDKHIFPPGSKKEQYGVLAEKSSTGEYWYDIILGHVNDRAFIPVVTRLESLTESHKDKKKFESGLDVGSGLGNTLRVIAPYCEKVTGVEQLEPLVEKVKNDPRTPENVEIIQGDAKRLRFPDESFDVIVSNGLTHYFNYSEMQNYVREISRLLKDGGRYIEAYTIKEPDRRLPASELEYLTSAKALLVCLMDNIVSKVKVPRENDPYDPPWNFSDMIKSFHHFDIYQMRSFSTEKEDKISEQTNGAVAFEFYKNKKEQAENRKGWISGVE